MTIKLSRHNSGKLAEFITCILLIFSFYTILERRYKGKFGEIDIIAKRHKTIIFVEVKSQRHKNHDEMIIHENQKKRICKSANNYLARRVKFHNYRCRFDLVIFNQYFLPKYIKNAWENYFLN
jgi:putative endonuclease